MKQKFYLGFIVLCIVSAIGIIMFTGFPKTEDKSHLIPTAEPKTIIQEHIVEKEVQKETSVETMEDGLREMGFLIAHEYYFKDVIDFRKTEKFLLFFNSEASFLATYEGKVSAGVDFSKIEISKDEETRTVFVTVPSAEIKDVVIDHESFVKYSEKDGIATKLEIDDYNEALIELEHNARTNAIEHGILEKSDEQAKMIIRNFLVGLLDGDNYAVIFAE